MAWSKKSQVDFMNNSTANIAMYFYVALAIFIFVLVFSIGETLNTAVLDTFNTMPGNITNSTLMQSVESSRVEVFALYNEGIKFILYLIIAYSIFSSFIQRNDIISYLVSFCTSILAGAIFTYVILMFYNTWLGIVSTIPYYDLTYLPTFFFENLALLIFANIIAGILSFVFIKRDGFL
jgi:hypothetical protein